MSLWWLLLIVPVAMLAAVVLGVLAFGLYMALTTRR